MLFGIKHAGKWVATKGERIVDSSRSLKILMRRTDKRGDRSGVRYSLVPKDCLAGRSIR